MVGGRIFAQGHGVLDRRRREKSYDEMVDAMGMGRMSFEENRGGEGKM